MGIPTPTLGIRWSLEPERMIARLSDLPPTNPHRPSSMNRQGRLMDSVLHDLRFALRLFGKSPGFTAAVVASLSLGIGANTAIFTLMDAVMWRMLPVSDPESLLAVGRQEGSSVFPGFTYGQYRLIRDNNSMSDLAGYSAAPINVSVDGPPEPSVQGQLVSGNYFSLLGVSPVIGRAIGPDDDLVPNGHPVAMLSHGYWERRFARDASVVGRTVRFSGMPFTIVGVTPRDFFGVDIGTAPDVFLPLMMQPTVMPAYENLLDRPDRESNVGSGHRSDQSGRQRRSGRRSDGRGASRSGHEHPACACGEERAATQSGGARPCHCGVIAAPAVFPAVVRTAGDGGRRAPDRLRQYRQPAPRTRRGTAAGVCDAPRPRRRSRPPDASAVDRKRGAGGARRRVWRTSGPLGDATPRGLHVVRTYANRDGSHAESAHPGVYRGGVGADRSPLRARTGMAGHQDRSDAGAEERPQLRCRAACVPAVCSPSPSSRCRCCCSLPPVSSFEVCRT